MYAIVNTQSGQVLPQKNTSILTFTSLSRVDLPDGTVVFNPAPGYEFGVYKLFPVAIDKSGVGSIVSDSAPVYDGTNVIVTRMLSNPPTTVADVRTEAERRISKGILVNGKPFRCDDGSVLRMRNLKDALATAPVGTTQTFNTAAGDTFTVNAAQAAAISDAQINWQGAILAASASLQASPPADPTLDQHWPVQTTLP
jgi:hypothetical protein